MRLALVATTRVSSLPNLRFVSRYLATLTGALFAALFVLFIDAGWGLPIEMFRERAMVLSLCVIPVGWLSGLLAMRLSLPGLSASLLGFGVALLPTYLVVALLVIAVGFLLRNRLPASMAGVGKLCKALGVVVHILPLVVYFGVPHSLDSTPRVVEPELPAAAVEQKMGQGPDVVLVIIDTLRADAILEDAVPTPHIDALRNRGVWASYAVAPANQTLPSHLSILCGLDIEKIGMRGNPSPWPQGAQLREAWGMQTLAERFYDGGWRTAAVASNTLLSRVDESKGYQGYRDGFELWNGMERDDPWKGYLKWSQNGTWLGWFLPKTLGWHKYSAFVLSHIAGDKSVRGLRFHKNEGVFTTDASVRYIQQLTQGERPYFFLAQYLDPHTPYMPDDAVRGTLSKEELRPAGFDTSESSEMSMRLAFREGLHAMIDAGEVMMNGSTLSLATWLHHLYREEIMALDTQLGRLFGAIEKGGRPTIVLFTSDHGEAFGEHGNINHGSTVYTEEIHVPFVLAGANVPSTGLLPNRVEVVDTARTLLELAGLPANRVDGQNVLSGYQPRVALATMVKRFSVEDTEWKLVASVDYGNAPKVGEYELQMEQLFHISVDPFEKDDLLAKEVEQARRLRSILVDRLKLDLRPSIEERVLSRIEQQQLDALGYAGGDDEH